MKGTTGRRAARGDEAKRTFFNARLGAALKGRLEVSAAAAGRSLSEEIERRLDRSLEDPLGDPRSAEAFKSLGNIARQVAIVRRQHWLDDYAGFQAIIERWLQYLEKIRPAPPEELVQQAEYIRQQIDEAARTGERARIEAAVRLIKLSILPAPIAAGLYDWASTRTAISVDDLRSLTL